MVKTGRLPGRGDPRAGIQGSNSGSTATVPQSKDRAGQRPLGSAGSRQRLLEVRKIGDTNPRDDG